MLNFLSNAVKYNRVGGNVWLSCEEFTPGKVRIAVNDTGSGIAQEKLEKLFTPFERLDADQRGIEGTGLGLVVSRLLAETTRPSPRTFNPSLISIQPLKRSKELL